MEAADLRIFMRETLLSFLDDCLARGSETAVVYRRGLRTVPWTCGQIAARAFQFARELETRDIAHGDRVLFWGENSAEWIAAFFGLFVARRRGGPARSQVRA